MKSIYKYPIDESTGVRFEIDLPRGADILAFQIQWGRPHLWVLVDRMAPTEPVAFRIFGTGHDIEDADAAALQHVGTIHDGSFVWHLFREARR